MTEISVYDKPTFSWLTDSNAPDVKSGVATFTYRQSDSGRLTTATIRFESFATANEIDWLLSVAHEAGYKKGLR
jgi:hypothetical protein